MKTDIIVINNSTVDADKDNRFAKHPVKKIQGLVIDITKKNRRYFVKKAFQSLTNPERPMDANSVRRRIVLVRHLENVLRTRFESARDFRRKIENYLKNYEIRKGTAGDRIKKARKKSRLTQKELAKKLGFKTHVTILNYEKGKRYPEEKVFQWLNEVGV